MKKIILFFAVAICSIACTKESAIVEEKPLVFTGDIAEFDSKTSIDGTTGAITWKIGDKITINDYSKKNSIYKVTSVSTTGRATFEYVSGDAPTEAPYSAEYGDINDQWYDANNIGSNCPMIGKADSDLNFNFTNSCGVIYFSATATNISKITIGSYSLSFPRPVSMNAGENYYMVAIDPVQQTSTTEVTLVKSDGRKYAHTASGSISVAKNHIKKVKFTSANFGDNTKYTGFEPLALPGVFTLSSGKKVRYGSHLRSFCTIE